MRHNLKAKTKTYTFVILFFFSFYNIYAQEQWGWQAIDTTYLVCEYEYVYPEGLLVPQSKDKMYLEIGKNLSKFYSRLTFEYDSLGTTPEGRAINRQKIDDVLKATVNKSYEEQGVILSGLPSRQTEYIIYKNYPLAGNMYVQDVGGYDHYEYYDDYIPQQWSIMEDTTRVLGYRCQKATCTWRGRDYEAWFTPEIPINDGPMKFFGLPGLILKIADTQNLYSFELKGIQNVSKPIYLNAPVGGNNSKFENLPITRNELQQKQLKYKKSIIRALKRDMTRLGKSTKGLDEKKFDLMELDYQ